MRGTARDWRSGWGARCPAGASCVCSTNSWPCTAARWVSIVLDEKTFAAATMVIALGITLSGEKRFLGFVETDTENERVLTPFLRSLVERGLDVSQGVLVILDGGKGRRSGRPSTIAPWSTGASGTSARTW